MKFESRRLRIQVVADEEEPKLHLTEPTICAEFDSLPPGCQGPSPIKCWAGSHLACAIYYTNMCEVDTRCEYTTHGCITESCRAHHSVIDIPLTEPIVAEADPGRKGGIVIKEEDLPRFREQLDEELSRLTALGERRKAIEVQVEGLDTAEEAPEGQAGQ